MKAMAKLRIEYIKRRAGKGWRWQWYVRIKRGRRILLHSEFYRNLKSATTMIQNLRRSLAEARYTEHYLTPLKKDPEIRESR
jgi:uncharacterized protein YegP (UPF0339 family)